ncbi:MAG: hypothetical protein KAU24_02840 [Candidatus Aenigmarchaeota archaeon]|nr:hypothetical protein [Candidatus Aenigmarchaeota archaeon]
MVVVLFQTGGILQQMLQNMQYMGFFLYLFPFLLALAIFYGVLSWSLGERLPKSARGLVSIIMAFFVMLYSSWNIWLVTFFAEYFGAGLVIACGILVVAILLGLAGYKIEDLFKGAYSKWVFILGIIIIAILIFFGAGAGWLIPIPYWSTSSELWTVALFIIILALAMWWLGSEGKPKEEATTQGEKKT